MNAEIQFQNQNNNNSSASAGGGGIIVRNRNNSSQSNVSMELEAFLATRRLKTGETYTHSRIKGSKGSWVIKPEDLLEFHRLYFAKIGSGAEDYLVERQTGNALYIDLDFKYVVGTEKHQHQFADIVAVCEKVVEICGVKYGFRLQNGESFKVFVMEKHMPDWGPDVTWVPVKGSPHEPVVKSGVHIQFCFKIPKYILKPLYQDILAELNGGLLNLPVINTWGDVLDKGVFEQGTNNILYGSIKEPGAKRYTLTKRCLEYVQQETDNILGGTIASPTISSANFPGISTNCAENVQPHWIEEEVVVPVPVRVARASAVAGGAIGGDAESVATSNAPIGDSSPEQYECVAEYIREGLLSRYVTAGQYKEWVNLGYALYASFGQVRGLVLWKLLSVERETDPAIGNRPDAQWARICGSFNTVATGVGAIHARAKSTNAKKQRVIWVKNIGAKKNLYGSMWSSGMIADYFKDLHKEFIFSQDNLYFFNGYIWDKCDKMCSQLVNFVDKVFVPELREYGLNRLQHFQSQSEDATDEAQRQIISKNIEMVLKFQGNVEGLRDVKKRKSLIEDIKSFVVQPQVLWDEQDYLFAFNNQVVDLRTGEVVEGNPLHYMTMSCGWDYDHNYPLEERKAELEAILNDIFLNRPEVMGDLLVYLSTGLSGLQQQFMSINTGVGANGKSVLCNLMLAVVGGYGRVLNPALLTRDIKDGANPELATLNKARYMSSSEPNKDMKLVVSVMKPLTGEGSIQVRTGFDFSGSACVLKLTSILFCNDIPGWDDLTQHATIRRLRMTHYKRKYVSADDFQQAQETGELMDNLGVGNPDYVLPPFCRDYRQAMFHILLDYFKVFYEGGKIMPKQPTECEAFKSDYLAGGDEVFVWFEAKFEKCDKTKNPPLSLTDIFKQFEMSSLYQNLPVSKKRIMNRKSFVANLQKNTNISPYIYAKGRSFMGKQIKADCLLGWKKREIDPITGLPVEPEEVLWEEEDQSCCSYGGGGGL